MRRSAALNPFTILFLFYLLAFCGFFVFSIFTFPGYVRVFFWPYVWTNSFTLFMRFCIPLTVAAVAAAYSLLPTTETVRRQAGRQPFARLVGSHLSTFIVLAILYTVLMLGLHPVAQRNMERFDSLSLEAQGFRERADAALEAGNLQIAVRYYQRYLEIDEDNAEIMALESELQMRMIEDRSQPSAEQALQQEEPASFPEGKRPFELLEMAQGYFEQEDYFSAQYYADLAYQLDPALREARRLAARAQERIAGKEFGRDEQEERRLYERKREGFEHFREEDYFEAYSVFSELAESRPQDADVLTYLARSREKLSERTFFLEDAERIDALPGATEILFINPVEEGEEQGERARQQDEDRQIVYIGKLAATEAGLFCKDVEVLGLRGGELLYSFSVPYGRISGKSIDLHGVARNPATGRTETKPRYLVGAGRFLREPLTYNLAIAPPPQQLPALRAGRTDSLTAASLGFFSLWQVRGQIAPYGYQEAILSAEILKRLLMPFSFLVLCLLSVAVGWRFQARFFSRPHWILFLLMPLFPLAAIPFTELYSHAQRIILYFVLLRLGFSLSLIVFVVLQALLLLTSMFVLAGQRTD